MVVPPRAQDAAGAGLIHGGRPRIICAVDFSGASIAALEYAMSLAEEADADLSLLHVIEVPPELLEHVPVPADFDVDRCHAAARAASLQRLRELITPLVSRVNSTLDDVKGLSGFARMAGSRFRGGSGPGA